MCALMFLKCRPEITSMLGGWERAYCFCKSFHVIDLAQLAKDILGDLFLLLNVAYLYLLSLYITKNFPGLAFYNYLVGLFVNCILISQYKLFFHRMFLSSIFNHLLHNL